LQKLADTPGVSIKPDMSKEERLTESALLNTRWELINSGTERKRIKIQRKSLYLDNNYNGSVVNSKYLPHYNSKPLPSHEATSSGANRQFDSD